MGGTLKETLMPRKRGTAMDESPTDCSAAMQQEGEIGMETGFNPFLPLSEYIPDGEPHRFGDRIYLFGSHDTEGGTRYCSEGNYVCWSAPLSDPCEWQYEGVIYEASQDPEYGKGAHTDLYAPDVVQGNDGRFYLYYNPVSTADGASGHDTISVAVCDTPAGKYEYLGYVRDADGTKYNPYLMGDPAVLNDAGTIRLYFGWSLSMVAADAHQRGQESMAGKEVPYGGMTKEQTARMLPKPGDPQINRKLAPVYQMLFKRTLEQVKDLSYPLMGANTIELEDDMLTVRGEIHRIVPGQFDTPRDSSFYGHAFYEASSIRKINGTYYFIYSSENSNELCYATSLYPDRDFTYGGTIISNGDVGYHGLKKEDRHNQTANDHGSLECINGQWYIFHHRQTHSSTFSRQACAEKVEIRPDGSIPQVECTSMGFHQEALPTAGTYPAPLSCILTNGHMPHITNTVLKADIPYITNQGETRFITGVKEGVLIGYKYFAFNGRTFLSVQTRGSGRGRFVVLLGEKDQEPVPVGEIAILPSREWVIGQTSFSAEGEKALYLKYEGEGKAELLSFSFS